MLFRSAALTGTAGVSPAMIALSSIWFLFAVHIAYIPNMDTEFEWDPEKAESNYQRHGVSIAEAATVFFDQLRYLTRCIPLTKTASSSLDRRTSNAIWSWCTRIGVIEYESLVHA